MTLQKPYTSTNQPTMHIRLTTHYCFLIFAAIKLTHSSKFLCIRIDAHNNGCYRITTYFKTNKKYLYHFELFYFTNNKEYKKYLYHFELFYFTNNKEYINENI